MAEVPSKEKLVGCYCTDKVCRVVCMSFDILRKFKVMWLASMPWASLLHRRSLWILLVWTLLSGFVYGFDIYKHRSKIYLKVAIGLLKSNVESFCRQAFGSKSTKPWRISIYLDCYFIGKRYYKIVTDWFFKKGHLFILPSVN